MKRIKNRKALLAIVALLLITVVGTTLAFFYSSGTFTNVFQAGTYRLVTTEVFQSPDNWKPGDEVSKIITTKNEGTVPAAVRMSYTEEWFDSNDNDITSEVDRDSAIINFDNTKDWIYEDGYYYYKYILEPDQETSSFIKSVTLNDNIGEMECTMENLTEVCEATSPAVGAKYVLTITKETVQYSGYHDIWDTEVEIEEKPSFIIIAGEKENLQPGDIVGIGDTEDFYVLSSDNSEDGKTLLLAKYSLLVGNREYDWDTVYTYSSEDPGYGLQMSGLICGYSCSECDGVVSFSENLYWNSNDDIASPYNDNGDIHWDANGWSLKRISTNETVYPYVYDSNSNVYQYISGENGYVNRLIEMGAPSTITGRLLSYEEAETYRNVKDEGTSIIFGDHSYWLGSAVSPYNVWSVDDNGDYYSAFISDNLSNQIRPVIEVYTKDIG